MRVLVCGRSSRAPVWTVMAGLAVDEALSLVPIRDRAGEHARDWMTAHGRTLQVVDVEPVRAQADEVWCFVPCRGELTDEETVIVNRARLACVPAHLVECS